MKTKRILALEARRDTLSAELTKLDEQIIERGADLTEAEQAAYDEMAAELDSVGAELGKLIKRESDLAASVALGASLGAATNRNGGQPDGDGEPIYREDGEHSLLLDIYRARTGDHDANERLAAHRDANADIVRASALSNFGGLVIPKYAVDKYQPLAVQNGRPFLNTLVGTPSYGRLTSASVIIPQETVAPGMGAQTGENVAFATANWATTGLTLNAVTVGGYADVSVQSVQLGQVREQRMLQEMLRRYYNDQERQALWGSGAAGEVEGVFMADGTQTVNGAYSATGFGEIYGLVHEAASKVEINDEREAMYVLMSPGRWRSLISATDTGGRPIAGLNGTFPENVGAYRDAGGQRWFAGMRAVVSSRVVKAGEDDTVMAVYHPDFAYFEESDPYSLTADQVVAHTGSIRFVQYGFMIFSPEVRVNSLCLIQNLGIPTFPIATVS